LDFECDPPDAAQLARQWHDQLARAREVVDLLPAAEVGRCVLAAGGQLCRDDPNGLAARLAAGELRFHAGSIRGALPRMRTCDQAGG
jgi:hypothetical protein